MSTAERILEAARALLIRGGPEAVTMRAVAAEVGVSAMASYKHYPSREALLRAVADAALADLTRAWAAGMPPTVTNLHDLLDRGLEDFLDFALGHPRLYAFLLTDRREKARRFPGDFDDNAATPFGPLVGAVQRAMGAGLVKNDDPLEVAMAIGATTQGLVQLYLGGRIGLPEPEFRALCRRTIERILHGLAA